MSISNGYATLADFKLYTGIGANDDTIVEYAIEAASREIDNYTGRTFYQAAGGVRVYTATDWDLLLVDDIYNTTNLAVAQDTNGDGTFDTTWTITTDFVMQPGNPRAGWPYTSLTISRSGARWFEPYVNGFQVTANYGWAAVPTDVKQATLMQANRLVHRRNSPEGVAGFSEFGVARISRQLDPDAVNLLEPFRKLVAVI